MTTSTDLFVESAPEAFIIVNDGLEVEKLNPAARRLLAVEPAKNQGLHLKTLLPRQPDLLQDLQNVSSTGVPLFRKNEVIHCGTKDVHVSIRAFKTETGLGIIASDISELKHVLEEARQFNRFLKHIIANAGVYLQVIDEQMNVLIWNEAAENFTDFTMEEVIGHSRLWSRMLPEDSRNQILEQLSGMINGDGDITDEQVRIRTKFGEEKILNWHWRRILDEYNEPEGAIGLAFDITAKKQLEEQLFQSQKMESIGTLAGGVAHDFNNLLTVIQGNADLVLDDLDRDNLMFDSLNEISSTAQRAADLTRQLLLFSRQHHAVNEPMFLNHNIRALLKMLHRLLGENMKIETQLGDDLWWIKADSGHIEQMIMNLCINARDAMDGGGKLTITTKNVTLDNDRKNVHPEADAGDYISLSIEDQGCGMPPEVLSRIFEPFYTTKAAEEGTGLGLAVAYGVVRDLDGWIDVESSENEGTEFTIFLPACPDYDGHTGETTTASHQANIIGNGETVLLIEDELAICRSLSRALRKNGYEVFQANNANHAREVFEQEKHRIRIIVSDVVLPDGNGFELAETFQKEMPNIEMLLITGYADRHWNKIQQKRYQILPKPFSLNAFLETVDELTEQETE